MITYRRLADCSAAKRAELAAVMAVDGDENRYGEFVSFLEEEFRTIDPARRAYVVAEDGGVIVGFIRLWHSPHIDEWINDGMVVAPARRREGIGQALVRAALALAGQMGARSVLAHIGNDNAASIRLHEKAGFVKETTHYRNSYGQWREGGGWQYRVAVPT